MPLPTAWPRARGKAVRRWRRPPVFTLAAIICGGGGVGGGVDKWGAAAGKVATVAAARSSAAPPAPPAVPVPAEWAAAAERGDLLFAASPPDQRFLPPLENGFLGGDVGCAGGSGGSAGGLRVAGVFSGGSNPHGESRATVPNPIAAAVVAAGSSADESDVAMLDNAEGARTARQTAPTPRGGGGGGVGAPAQNRARAQTPAVAATPVVFGGAALDLRGAAYVERWSAPGCGETAVITSRRYAHRQYRSVVVWELSASNISSSPSSAGAAACVITLQPCPQRAQGVVAVEPGLFRVVDPEQPADPSWPKRNASEVAVAADAVPATVTLSPNAPLALFVAVVRSTLEPSVASGAAALALATAELAAQRAQGTSALRVSHEAAWDDAYGLARGSLGGGVEVRGNRNLAVCANASWFYLLSSVRDDWQKGVSEGGVASQAYRGMSFWSDGVMDGPLFSAISAPIADALLQYRLDRLPAAKSIAALNGYQGAYWPWQSAVTGFERSCGNVSIVQKPGSKTGCYWMHEVHVSADTALSFQLGYRRKALNATFLRSTVWPVVSATADFFASRVSKSSDPSGNWTLLQVIGPDEHSYIVDSNAYTNAAAGAVMRFAADAAVALGLSPPTVGEWRSKGGTMLVPTAMFCLAWPNASVAGCPRNETVVIHPQYAGYNGQDINQADVALLQWPLHHTMPTEIAANDLLYYARRTSGSDTKGFYTGDSSMAIAYLTLGGHRDDAAAQLALANHHMIGPFLTWTETDPTVAANNGTGNLNFLTGAGGFLENLVFGYGGVRYTDGGLELNPSLPPGNTTELVVRGLSFADGVMRMTANATSLRLSHTAGGVAFAVRAAAGGATLPVGRWPAETVLPLQRVVVTVASNKTRAPPVVASTGRAEGSIRPASRRSHASRADGSRPPRELNRPQYVLFSPDGSPGHCSNATNWTSALLDVRAGVQSTGRWPVVGDSGTVFGVHLLFELLDCDETTLHTMTAAALEAASATEIPVFFGWDPQVWWESRPDLWNWWDPTKPGYDPANVANVEWAGWGDPKRGGHPAMPLKISWLNWGRQLRMAPSQNIHAPAVKVATRSALLAVSSAVASWWSRPGANRLLLAGVKLGCEAGIGWQTWYYPHGNAIYNAHPTNASHDPTYGPNHTALPDPPTWGLQQIGFAAATASRLKTSGPLTNADVQTLTHWFLANLTAVAVGAGVPKSVLLSHYGGTLVTRAGGEPTMPYAAGELPGVSLGVSLYVTPLDDVPSFAPVTARAEGWGAVEFGLGGFWAPPGAKVGSEAAWSAAVNGTLGMRGCRLISQVPLTPVVVAAALAYAGGH